MKKKTPPRPDDAPKPPSQREPAFEHLIATISNRFINCEPGEVNRAVSEALEEIGRFADVDRSYVFQFSADMTTLSNTHEWCREGIEPAIDELQDLKTETLPWIIPQHRRSEVVCIPRVSDLPPEAGAEKKLFQSEGIQSLICVPLACGRKVLGFVGFDSVRSEKKWSKQATVLFRLIGEVFANAIERRNTNEALLESEARFRDLAESTSDWIWEVDQAGRYTYCSPQIKQLLGYDVDEVLGRTPFDFMPPAEAARVKKTFLSLAAAGKPLVMIENVNLHKDGHEVVLETSGVPAFDRSGRQRGYRGIDRDITERKRSEEDLREERDFSDGIIDSLPGLFYIFDEERFLRWNSNFEQVSGYSAEELEQMYGPDFFEGEGRTLITEKMRQVFREGFSTAEAEFVTKDGRKIPYFFTGLRKELSGGKPCLIGLGIDITERRRAERERRKLEAQIQRAQKLESLGVLAGGIAHDFNNLLVAILGHADLALMQTPGDSPQREGLLEIKAASQRAAELAEQMLAFSGKGRFVAEALDLGQLVESMAHMLKVSISANVVLTYHLGRNLPAVKGDATQIRQVILNLITNASEAIGDREGAIRLTTRKVKVSRRSLRQMVLGEDLPGGTYVLLEVADTGSGMDEKTKARLFEPFFTTKFTGRGLGMASVLGIVRGHEGAIRIDSEKGQGARIRVYLPLAESPALASPKEKPAKADLPPKGAVLLVDDDEAVRKMSKKMLECLGMEVELAVDGHDAVERFRKRADRTDCVILDLTMPGMSGEETFEALRRIRGDIPIIVSSGYSEDKVAQRLGTDDLYGFIQKPYEMSRLAEVLRSLRT